MENTKFPTFWSLYFHNPDDLSDWSLKSYDKVGEFRYFKDFVFITEKFTATKNFKSGMFFLMRENIPPRWEDDLNRNGGYWSFVVHFDVFDESWTSVCYKLMNETLMDNSSNTISGISISPKKEFSILKVWNTDKIIGKNMSCNLNGTPLSGAESKFILFENKKK